MCPDGTLFNEMSSQCTDASLVNCSEKAFLTPEPTEGTIQQFSSPFKEPVVVIETEDSIIPVTESPTHYPTSSPTTQQLEPSTQKPVASETEDNIIPVTESPTHYPTSSPTTQQLEPSTQKPVAFETEDNIIPVTESPTHYPTSLPTTQQQEPSTQKPVASAAFSFMQAASSPTLLSEKNVKTEKPTRVPHKPANKGQESLTQMLDGFTTKNNKKKLGRLKAKKKQKSQGVGEEVDADNGVVGGEKSSSKKKDKSKNLNKVKKKKVNGKASSKKMDKIKNPNKVKKKKVTVMKKKDKKFKVGS
jgi:hypothetical protein